MKVSELDIEEVVGRGGSGVVHRAVWRGPYDEVSVAIKLLEPHKENAQRWFLNEARMAGRLSHPNVVTLLDAGHLEEPLQATGRTFDPQTPYLVMEWVTGATIDDRPPGDWAELRATLRNVLDALGHAHGWGVLHRDIKPGNVLVTEDGASIKLTDFGISRPIGPGGELPDESVMVGTPNYMAPEQILGSWRDEGPWTDLYGLGILAWRLATGSAPYVGDQMAVLDGHLDRPLPEFRPEVDAPAGFEEFVRRLAAKSPDDRYRTAGDARRSLDALETGRPSQFVVPETWPGEDRPVPRDLRAAGLGLFGIRQPPLAGREVEKTVLWNALREAAESDTPRAVAIRGGPGSGKTALADWLSRRAADAGLATTFRATHDPYPVPGDGLEGTLARYLRLDGLERDDAVNRTAAALSRLGFDAHAVGLAPDVVERTATAERTRRGLATRDEWFGVLRRIFAAICEERPVILVVDDGQWGEPSLDFALRLLGSDLPVVVLVTLRDGFERDARVDAILERFLEHPATTALELGPLDDSAQRALVSDLLSLEPGLVDEAVARTAGSPLFATQLVGDWVARGLLEPGPLGYRARDPSASELPDDIHIIWQERVGGALKRSGGENDRRALALAAILGSDIPTREWLDAARRADCEPSSDLLDILVVDGLARWRFNGFSFVHRMLRESILLDADRLPALHGAVSDALIASESGDGRKAERIAHHLREAGDDERAFEWLTEAVERYYQEENLDGVLVLAGELSEWAERAGATGSIAHAEALVRYGTVLRFRVQMDAATDTLTEAIAMALEEHRTPEDLISDPDPDRNRVVARAYAELAVVRDETEVGAGGSLTNAETSRRIAAAADLPAEEAWAAALLGGTLSELGQAERGLEIAREALATLTEADLLETKHGLHTHFTLSEVAKVAGDHRLARDHLERGLGIARRIGQRVGVAYGLARMADEAYRDGRLDDARDASRHAMDLYAETGSPSADYMETNLVMYDLEEGRTDACRERLERLLTRWERYGLERLVPVLQMALAAAHAAEQSPAEARKSFDAAVAGMKASGRVLDDVLALAVLVAEYATDELRAEAMEVARSNPALLPDRYVERLASLE